MVTKVIKAEITIPITGARKIKKREIYQVMEIVTDKFEDAANVMDSILVKYA